MTKAEVLKQYPDIDPELDLGSFLFFMA